MRIAMAENEYGTPVSVHVCTACGKQYTVCPAATDEEWGSDCLALGCPSYDERRDIDRVWEGVHAFVVEESA